MSDFIDDFLAGLENDQQKPRTTSGLEKVLMSARDNQGTVVLAPFKDAASGKFYVLINGCKEYRTTLSSFKDGEDEVWVKILPKELYGNLTSEQSALYDEVVGLFDQLDADLGDIPNKWGVIRYRSYSLFQGVMINHLNTTGTKLTERLGKPVLLMFPSRHPINELANAIKNKMAGMNNSKEWIPAVFSPDAKGREGVLTISFTKPDAPGYDCTVGFEFNSPYARIVDPVEGFAEEVTKDFGDMTEEFLGWQNGENGKFNEANFKELKNIFITEIKKLSTPNPIDNQPAPENKNGVDPMLDAKPSPEVVQQSNTVASSPEVVQTTVTNAPVEGTNVKLPF